MVTDSSSCPAWILAGCLKPIQRKENAALLSVGMIHNQVLVLYFDGTVLHRVCDFRGNVRAMLYSMDLFDSITEGDEDGTLRYACHVSGGTMLWMFWCGVCRSCVDLPGRHWSWWKTTLGFQVHQCPPSVVGTRVPFIVLRGTPQESFSHLVRMIAW